MHKARYRVRSDGEVLDTLDLMADSISVIHITKGIPASGTHGGGAHRSYRPPGPGRAVRDRHRQFRRVGHDRLSYHRPGWRPTAHRPDRPALPGQAEGRDEWQLNDNGRMDVLDTSAQLTELRARVDRILDRIAANSHSLPPASAPSTRPPCSRIGPSLRGRRVGIPALSCSTPGVGHPVGQWVDHDVMPAVRSLCSTVDRWPRVWLPSWLRS